MGTKPLLSINTSNADPAFNGETAEQVLAELDARNAKAEARATYIKIGLGTVLIVAVFVIVMNWESIVHFFRQ